MSKLIGIDLGTPNPGSALSGWLPSGKPSPTHPVPFLLSSVIWDLTGVSLSMANSIPLRRSPP